MGKNHRGRREVSPFPSEQSMGPDYYFISDLHLGGDAELDVCDFEAELIVFLRDLAAKARENGREIELIIVGDAFGLWELTSAQGPDKLDVIITKHPELFTQIKSAGENITITLIPGNHDYELACHPGYLDRLQEFNVSLSQKEYITRAVAGRMIYIEHGSQNDDFNRISRFGDPYVTPLGYYFVRRIVSNFGKFSRRGREKWLRDVQSVQPAEQIPHWLFSNYFYREMNPILRWSLFPFLLLLGTSFVGFVGWLLDLIGLTPASPRLPWAAASGVFGFLRDNVLFVNALILAFVVLFCVPFWFAVKDVLKTFDRYGVRAPRDLPQEKERIYLRAAAGVFEARPEVAVYVYGHTHNASLRRLDDRVVVNTGTWIKRLTRTRDWIRILPDIYWPSFELSCFRVADEEGRIVIDYLPLAKQAPAGLTPLQRILLLGRRRIIRNDLPRRTVV
ncbi:MAG: metallophosphoesterase [Proteobacteria bacterium]|nr:metallophosphoesterase [Pseudomonadota bacterium]